MPNKTPEDIKEYSKSFWNKYRLIKNGEKYVERITKGESEIQKLEKIESKLLSAFKNLKEDFCIEDIVINYEKEDDKESFSLFEDQYLAYCLYKFGYGNWHLIIHEIKRNPIFFLNWKMQAYTSTLKD